jgi:phosphoribosylformylglycinamidine cyclo-ligase
MYHDGLFDLAGFCVGVVERDRLLDGSRVTAGDVVLGLASSGVHANGFSLVRAVMARCGAQAETQVGGQPLQELLLAPTRLYQPAIWPLLQDDLVHAVAHITGGGLVDNLPRVLPPGLEVHLVRDSWPLPAIFQWLQQQGNLDEATMLKTFNMGIGLCLIIPPHALEQSQRLLQEAHTASWVIGQVAEHATPQDSPRVVLR